MIEAFLVIALMNMPANDPLLPLALASELPATQREASIEVPLPHAHWQASIDSAVERAVDDLGFEMEENVNHNRIRLDEAGSEKITQDSHWFESHEEARIGRLVPRATMFR